MNIVSHVSTETSRLRVEKVPGALTEDKLGTVPVVPTNLTAASSVRSLW